MRLRKKKKLPKSPVATIANKKAFVVAPTRPYPNRGNSEALSDIDAQVPSLVFPRPAKSNDFNVKFAYRNNPKINMNNTKTGLNELFFIVYEEIKAIPKVPESREVLEPVKIEPYMLRHIARRKKILILKFSACINSAKETIQAIAVHIPKKFGCAVTPNKRPFHTTFAPGYKAKNTLIATKIKAP
ncbi:hypothetical protein [Olivibacter jilunii]|uniref:hypothetical protein n=1 Tax=Olivibacter jilunii TaxID=985016 RepID=UPI003F180F0D